MILSQLNIELVHVEDLGIVIKLVSDVLVGELLFIIIFLLDQFYCHNFVQKTNI